MQAETLEVQGPNEPPGGFLPMRITEKGAKPPPAQGVRAQWGDVVRGRQREVEGWVEKQRGGASSPERRVYYWRFTGNRVM